MSYFDQVREDFENLPDPVDSRILEHTKKADETEGKERLRNLVKAMYYLSKEINKITNGKD